MFLSYDHEDTALARPLASAMEKAGHSVWYDRHIHGGAQYSRKIEQALDAADAVVVLWSSRSLDSAWVRDEAADGRDRGKLVPLSIGGVTPPMGFRQFQTINLGEWKGRGKVPHIADILEAIRNQSDERSGASTSKGEPRAPSARPFARRTTIWLTIAALVLSAVAFGGWTWFNRDALPVVVVEAANDAPRSQAAASDLFVKLGSLAAVGDGKWQLVDSSSGTSAPSLIFRTADTGSAGQPRANLLLLEGKDKSVLWSREFEFTAGHQADLRQRLSLTAGRVLDCALEGRAAGGLPRDLMKLFLNACATLDEESNHEPERVARPLRAVIEAKPRFTPAWGLLLTIDTTIADLAAYSGGDEQRALRQLRDDVEKARAIDPDLPAISLAELKFLPSTAHEHRLNQLAKAALQDPDNAVVFSIQTVALQSVGRMNDAIVSARRAADLDPLSPIATTQAIMTLAYAGQLGEAREELAKAERLWAGTGALRDILWGFHLRYGDPEVAKKVAGFNADGLDVYVAARRDPTPANVERLVSRWRGRAVQGTGDIGFAIQGLAEFNQTGELVRWLTEAPTEELASIAYLLFRPSFEQFRRDPRFMAVAGKIGLADYWLSTGKWPDYCRQTDLPYDCKREAAKYAQ